MWQVHGVPVELLTVLGFVLLTLALHSALHPPDRAVLGTNVGVVGTPTTFLDGVRLPTVSPMGLADLLAGTAPRWPAKPAAVNPMR